MTNAKDILIALDDGHGMETKGKRTPAIPELDNRVIRENEFNREVVRLTNIELSRCGFRTLLTAPTDIDTPLSDRVKLANGKKVNLFISFHYNANTGSFITNKAEGFSAHVFKTVGDSADFGNILLNNLSKGTYQKNRGLVKQDLYVTRETTMPSVLIEFGFMDNKREAMLMIDANFQKECAIEVAKSVCEFYKVTYVAEVQKKEDKEEVAVSNLFNPESSSVVDSVSNVLSVLEQFDNGLHKQWRQRLTDNKLTDSQAIGLLYVAVERGLIQLKKQ